MSPIRQSNEISDMLIKASADTTFRQELLSKPCETAKLRLTQPIDIDVFCGKPPFPAFNTFTDKDLATFAREVKIRLTLP